MFALAILGLIAAMASATSLTPKAVDVEVVSNNATCMTPIGASALNKLLNWNTNITWSDVSAEIKFEEECIDDDLASRLLSGMTAIYEKTDTSALMSINPRSPTQLMKRIRTCPQIADGAKTLVSSYSCASAPNPHSCRSCEIYASALLVSGCLACAAKSNFEPIPCCVTTALTVVAYIMHICLIS